MSRSQWYIGAPNGIILCINSTQGGQLAGQLYHSYEPEGSSFQTVEQMTRCMEQLYDALQFPFPGNSERSFAPKKTANQTLYEGDRIVSDENLLSKHGDIGTFIVRVQHRQNSSWQGRITWMEEDKSLYFRSVWEMIKLIESAVNTVSTQEDEQPADQPWFQTEEAE